MAITMSGKKQAFIIALGKILAMIITFTVPLFLTRFLSKEDYGLYAQFYTILLFLAPIFTMGMSSPLYFFMPTADKEQKKLLVNNTYFSLLCFGIIGTALLFIHPIGKLILGGDELYSYINIIAICLVLIVPTSILEPLYVLRKDSLTTLLYPISEVLLKTIAVILMALIGGTLNDILIGIVITHVILFGVGFVYTLKGNLQKVPILDFRLQKKQLEYGVPFGMALFFNGLCRQFDKLVCISFLTASQFASYSVAFFGIPGIMQIYDSLCQVNVIDMTKSWQNGELETVLASYKNFVVKTLSFSLPIIVIVFLYAQKIIIFLFTEKYADSTIYFRIYILTFIVGMLGAGTILRASGKTKKSFKAYAISAFCTLPITYLLIKNYGGLGAISGSVLSTMLPRVLQIIYEIRLLKCSIYTYFPWKAFMQITVISLLALIPFATIEYFDSLNIYYSGCLATLYLILAYSLMIRYQVFIVDKATVNNLFLKAKHLIHV